MPRMRDRVQSRYYVQDGLFILMRRMCFVQRDGEHDSGDALFMFIIVIDAFVSLEVRILPLF